MKCLAAAATSRGAQSQGERSAAQSGRSHWTAAGLQAICSAVLVRRQEAKDPFELGQFPCPWWGGGYERVWVSHSLLSPRHFIVF